MDIREKTASEIKQELYELGSLEIRTNILILKDAKEISEKLTMIERGRKIDSCLDDVIHSLEWLRNHLENYPITVEQNNTPEIIPVGGVIW